MAQHGVDNRRSAEASFLPMIGRCPSSPPKAGPPGRLLGWIGRDRGPARDLSGGWPISGSPGSVGWSRRWMTCARPVPSGCSATCGQGPGVGSPCLRPWTRSSTRMRMTCAAGWSRCTARRVAFVCGGRWMSPASALVETVLARAGEDAGAAGRPGPEAVLVVDLSELDFLDVAGYRALRGGTEQWRRRGGTVPAHRGERRRSAAPGAGRRGSGRRCAAGGRWR